MCTVGSAAPEPRTQFQPEQDARKLCFCPQCQSYVEARAPEQGGRWAMRRESGPCRTRGEGVGERGGKRSSAWVAASGTGGGAASCSWWAGPWECSFLNNSQRRPPCLGPDPEPGKWTMDGPGQRTLRVFPELPPSSTSSPPRASCCSFPATAVPRGQLCSSDYSHSLPGWPPPYMQGKTGI